MIPRTRGRGREGDPRGAGSGELPRRLAFAPIVFLLLLPATARAHSFDPGLLALRESAPGRFDVVWTPPRGAGTLAPGATGARPRLPERCRILAAPEQHPGEPGTGDVEVFRVDCGAEGLRGATVSMPEIEGSLVDVIVRVEWADGTWTTGALHGRAAELALPGAAHGGAPQDGAPATVILGSYFRLGLEHIAIGFDHLLFVLGLLLLVDGFRALLATITAFTIAHSATLALAATGILRVPAPPVEALIAASIALLAAEVVRDPADSGLARRVPWVIAFALGLLHGLGFAGVLADVGLPRAQLALALVAFNLGVEAGQLAFVALVALPVLVAKRHWERRPWLRLGPAYAIGAVAAAWTFERALRCFTSGA